MDGHQHILRPHDALPGGRQPVIEMPFFHRVFGDRLDRQFSGVRVLHLAMGCFWGAEKLFWSTEGVLQTAVGYMGGTTPNPTYREVCTGRTGHAETVRVTYDPDRLTTAQLVALFLESHDPTQGMRQGHDVGTQYRSALWCTDSQQLSTAFSLRDTYQTKLLDAGFGAITTTFAMDTDTPFFLAEAEHQQYLYANPAGYACDFRTGVPCPA